jgi:hypothetical protein
MSTLKITTSTHLRWFALVLAAVIIAFLVTWKVWPNPRTAELPDLDQLKRKEAMAFVLGWQSKMVLGQDTHDKPIRFQVMRACMGELGVKLPQPVDYYLSDPERDKGARAQAFTEETFKQLGENPEIANHFGIASNMLLAISRYETGNHHPYVKLELERLVRALDLPPDLKNAPTTDLADWADKISRYFESLLARPHDVSTRNYTLPSHETL